jgi:hypothetical protein
MRVEKSPKGVRVSDSVSVEVAPAPAPPTPRTLHGSTDPSAQAMKVEIGPGAGIRMPTSGLAVNDANITIAGHTRFGGMDAATLDRVQVLSDLNVLQSSRP